MMGYFNRIQVADRRSPVSDIKGGKKVIRDVNGLQYRWEGWFFYFVWIPDFFWESSLDESDTLYDVRG